MSSPSAVERRKHRRCPMPARVNFHHSPSRRDWPGRCVDVSHGGMLMYVPASVPIQPGHPIQVKMEAISRPEYVGLGEKDVPATVVRVDRHAMLSMGHLAVGVRFDNQDDG
ncbi:MAG: PilZ domain-containing protein [Planctomycetota bacterium]